MRKSSKGVYLTMLAEFEKELLSKEFYNILPLERPTMDDLEKAEELSQRAKQAIQKVIDLSDNVLKTHASDGVDREVMARNNVDRYCNHLLMYW